MLSEADLSAFDLDAAEGLDLSASDLDALIFDAAEGPDLASLDLDALIFDGTEEAAKRMRSRSGRAAITREVIERVKAFDTPYGVRT